MLKIFQQKFCSLVILNYKNEEKDFDFAFLSFSFGPNRLNIACLSSSNLFEYSVHDPYKKIFISILIMLNIKQINK